MILAYFYLFTGQFIVFMLHTLKLLLPAIIPSWRFFDAIAPSPRVQYSLFYKESDTNKTWQEFRPRPTNLSLTNMLKRLLWNPKWNESLFLVSCCERLLDYPTKHSEDEILNRISNELVNTTSDDNLRKPIQLQFRIVFVHRKKNDIVEEVRFHSRTHTLLDQSNP